MPRYKNWIHLDLKGLIPSENRLLQWIERIGSGGFSAVLFEYEDRYPWQSLPGTFRKGYEHASWENIWAHCKKNGLEVIPLVQTYGHLEWLLKHDQWAHLRCGGNVNLICPQNPEIRPLIEAWLSEVARLHPDSQFVHVGLDEVYHMGECPACQKKAEASPMGVSSILLDHARFVCETVVRLGKRPIIWGDMFRECPENGIASLPSETVICDWTYRGGEGSNLPQLRDAGVREMMGASAIRCSYPSWCSLVGSIPERIKNITLWKEVAGNEDVSTLIHTVWARSRGLSSVYGPWEAWLPAFDTAAGRPLSEVIEKGIDILQGGHDTGHHHQIEDAAEEMKKLHSSDPFEEQALRWWEISLRYRAETFVLFYRVLGQEELLASRAWQGCDPDLVKITEQIHRLLLEHLDALEKDIHAWLTRNEWSDVNEYLDERLKGFRRISARVPEIA